MTRGASNRNSAILCAPHTCKAHLLVKGPALTAGTHNEQYSLQEEYGFGGTPRLTNMEVEHHLFVEEPSLPEDHLDSEVPLSECMVEIQNEDVLVLHRIIMNHL